MTTGAVQAARAATEAGSALADPAAWQDAAIEVVANLGFSLVDGDRPGPSGSHLVIGLRREPTERHFDPEEIRFYSPNATRGGGLVALDRGSAVRTAFRQVLWGHVHLVDRYGIENRFLTFGGRLRATRAGDDLVVADLWSPGPIVRWGGHSQGTDWLTGEIGAFFGRLIVPIDYLPGAEKLVDAAPPEDVYGAFLVDLERRLRAAAGPASSPDELRGWVAAERHRMGSAAFGAGGQLLDTLGLAR
ncbi:MAG TPA: hypothetical protein VKR30_06215 [Candidatus Limnocylindrales bacterium]|nr:hypothetical protein [Candidatus Limnocylindrales bacterium]